MTTVPVVSVCTGLPRPGLPVILRGAGGPPLEHDGAASRTVSGGSYGL